MVALGTGAYTYEVIENWAKLPAGWSFKEVGGVGTDAQDNVYVFNRGAHPMMVFDRHGNFLRAWGEGCFHARMASPWHPTTRCSAPTTATTPCASVPWMARSC